ncbi:MAG TPA: tetratricopeptide repeat protein [Atribacteraceae bacterium]|nr:tetratricopeptide repeat protein [Atribacteraceae bacterium]
MAFSARLWITLTGITLTLMCLTFLSGCGGIGVRETGSVSGEVWSDFEPLSGVLVEAQGVSTTTGPEGDFFLDRVPVGERYLFFSRTGFTGNFSRVRVEKGRTSLVNPEGRIFLALRNEQSLAEYIFILYEGGLYERAIFESEQFLTEYPAGSRTGDIFFIQGASWYYLGEYQKAVDALSEMSAFYPENLFADDARYLLAKSYGEGLGNFGAAIVQYRYLVDNYPHSPLVPTAYFEMADAYYILGFFFEAAQIYELTIGLGGEVGRKATYALGHCYYRMNQHQEAARQFALYVALYPATDLSDDAQYFEGASHFQNRKFPEALIAFEKTVINYPNGTWYNGILIAPAALFHKGLSLERMGRFQEAHDVYVGIIVNYPRALWADGTSLVNSARFRIDWLRANVL